MTTVNPPAPPPKPKCPECDTELVLIDGKPPEECAKCGFVLAGYFDIFERWMAAWKKKNMPEPEPVARPTSKNPFARLRNK